MRYLFIFSALLILAGCNDPQSKLKGIVDEANKNYPAMVDSETKIENIVVKGNNTLRYNYTLVNVLRQNVDTFQFRRAMWPGIISMIKLSPDMKQLRESGTTFEYFYSDKNKIGIYTFTVMPAH